MFKSAGSPRTQSVDDFFRGIANVKFALDRAEEALQTYAANRNPFDVPGLFFECSLAISIVTDWAYHSLVADHPAWHGYSGKQGAVRFARWVRNASVETAALAEIANTFKHYQRHERNELVTSVTLVMNLVPSEGMLGEVRLQIKETGVRETESYVADTIDLTVSYGNQKLPFTQIAARSILWWRAFDPGDGPRQRHAL